MIKPPNIPIYEIEIINNGFLLRMNGKTLYQQRLSDIFSAISADVEEKAKYGGIRP